MRDQLNLIRKCIEDNLENEIVEYEEKEEKKENGNNSIKEYYHAIQKYLNEFKSLDFSEARYGSRAFQEFIQAAEEKVKELDYAESWLLIAAFGNATRLDYGTGHELQFIRFLAHNPQLSFYKCLGTYLKCQREVIRTFRLEPAGSKGVWGLDDYFFAPYLFGAAQLAKHPICTPEEAISKEWKQQEDDYLYLWALGCARRDKGAAFASHSPMLWDISGLPSWAKIRDGLLKMYNKEVLENPKIIQNFFST